MTAPVPTPHPGMSGSKQTPLANRTQGAKGSGRHQGMTGSPHWVPGVAVVATLVLYGQASLLAGPEKPPSEKGALQDTGCLSY